MTDIPDSMTAIEISTPGGPEVLKPCQRPVPVPGEGELLVRVAASGVNRPDVVQRMGLYPAPPGASDLPGLEISGTVVAVGPGAGAEFLGQRVCALVAGGGYAEYCLARADVCWPVPDDLSMEEAAAIPETLMTVWHNVFERGYADEGETILVHGGTSGIGSMAIKLGKLFGLTVIVTCGSDEKCASALDLGADHAINYKDSDFVEEVKRITDGAGVHLVLDMVAGSYVPRNMKCLRDDGRHVTIAIQGGAMAEVPIVQVMARRLTLTGSTLRPRSNAFKALLADEIYRNVWPEILAGRLRPAMAQSFPLVNAAAAHALMESGDFVGKIVLVPEKKGPPKRAFLYQLFIKAQNLNPAAMPKRRGSSVKMLVNNPDDWSVTYKPVVALLSPKFCTKARTNHLSSAPFNCTWALICE
jgi:NADPH:quinone reductase